MAETKENTKPSTGKATRVIDYIVQRLADEGITDCFGVPGDYAFPVNDAVDRNPNIRWVGCSNELNASYAAAFFSRWSTKTASTSLLWELTDVKAWRSCC